MRNRKFLCLALLFAPVLLSGCAGLPCLSFLPGPAYDSYVFWKSGEVKKYYVFDLDTAYRAVMRASNQLKLETTLIKSVPKEGYSLETKGNVPMHIDILPLEKNITIVAISIPTFGDKHYVELFYSLIDDNLHNKAAVGKEKTQ